MAEQNKDMDDAAKIVYQAQKSQARRTMPMSELDMQMMMTNPEWGKLNITAELDEKLAEYAIEKGENGEAVVTKESLWSLLGFYTRDLRLGNLSQWNGEVQYCQWYLDLAGDFLQSDMIKPFLICLSRVITILELSQSKAGFLRRRQNTFTSEQYKQELEPPKKHILGGNKNKGQGGS